MKIVDVTLTMFTWDGLPRVAYGPDIPLSGGSCTLGLLAIRTDEGLTGHAFLGAANRGAEVDGPNLIALLKPVVMGQNPLDRERLYHRLWGRGRAPLTPLLWASQPS